MNKTTRQIRNPLRQSVSSVIEPYWRKVLSFNPIVYWTQGESGGLTALDSSGNSYSGTYSGVTLGQVGISDGKTSALYSTALMNGISAPLASAFDGQTGSIAMWVKVVNVGVWSDETLRVLMHVQADGSNAIQLLKNTGAGTLRAIYRAGGTFKARDISVMSGADWFHFALTWNLTSDAAIAYINGIKQGATLTGVGTWAGDPTIITVGANDLLKSNPTEGYLAHVGIFDTTLTPAQVLSLAAV